MVETCTALSHIGFPSPSNLCAHAIASTIQLVPLVLISTTNEPSDILTMSPTPTNGFPGSGDVKLMGELQTAFPLLSYFIKLAPALSQPTITPPSVVGRTFRFQPSPKLIPPEPKSWSPSGEILFTYP